MCFKRWLAMLAAMVLLCSGALAETTYLINQKHARTNTAENVYAINTEEMKQGFGLDAYLISAENTPQDDPVVPPSPAPVDPMENLKARRLKIIDASAPLEIRTHTKGDYLPDHVLDNNNYTCWQFKISKSNNLNDAFIVLVLDQPCAVNKVLIKQGFRLIAYQLSQYVRNGRPTEVEISFRYHGTDTFADPIRFSIPDDWDDTADPFHEMEFDWKTNVIEVRVKVCGYVRGTKFEDDVAITELALEGLPMSEVTNR